MMEDFYCFSCGKRKPIEARSDKKIGRYKKSYQCITCSVRAKKNTVNSNKDPEALIGYGTYKLKHLRKAYDNTSKKHYRTDVTYNQFKERYDI
jgi:hypothetical protein